MGRSAFDEKRLRELYENALNSHDELRSEFAGLERDMDRVWQRTNGVEALGRGAADCLGPAMDLLAALHGLMEVALTMQERT